MKFLSPWLHISDICNCQCKYCFVANDKTIMSSKIINQLNKYILKKIKNNQLDYCKYRIAGGEPLLFIDRWFNSIKYFLDNIRNNGGVEILSNFTIYPDLLDTLLSHQNYCNINISLDNLKYSKPYKNGQTSHKETKNNIEKYIKRYNRRPFIMTVIIKNGKYLPELAEYIISINAKWEIQTNKYYEKDFNSEMVNENMQKVLNIFEKNNYSIDNILYNFCDLTTERICENGKSMFAIMPNGDIMNCQMQTDIIGNVLVNDLLTVLDDNKLNRVIRDEKCIGCNIFKYCHGDCPYKNQDNFRREYICKIMKFYVLKALKIKQRELKNA